MLRDIPGVWVTDCTGKRVQVPRPLQGVEVYVAWADTRTERAAIDAAMTRAIEAVAKSHRVDTWQAMRDGWQPGEYDRVLADAVPRYRRVLSEYTTALQRASERWALDEARRQAASSETETAPASPARTMAVVDQVDRQSARLAQRIDKSAHEAAIAIATRVQAEVLAASRNGKSAGTWVSGISAASLAQPAKAVGQIIESEGRMSAAASLVRSGATQRLGLRLAQVVRTSVNDPRRCSVCEKASGTTFDLPAQQAQFDAMPLPDPNCLGGTRYCRCGWLLRWVRET